MPNLVEGNAGMYEAFFGLNSRPFADHADPDFFVETEQHGGALRALRDGLKSQHLLSIVTGEMGCGKTTLARKVLHEIDENIMVGFVASPPPSVGDLAPWALLSFGLEATARSGEDLQETLILHFIAEYAEGRNCLLVVDEAQNLTPSALAGLHQYLDLNTEGDCLLQVILIAQPVLLLTMRDPTLARWAARAPLVCPVGPLPFQEVPTYVRSRLAAAGGHREIFTDRAIAAVADASGGVPRLINAICDMALTYAFSQGSSRVDRDLIEEIVSEGSSVGFGSFAMLAPIEAEVEIEAPVAETSIAPIPLVAGPDAPIEAEPEVEIEALVAETEIAPMAEPEVDAPVAETSIAPVMLVAAPDAMIEAETEVEAPLAETSTAPMALVAAPDATIDLTGNDLAWFGETAPFNEGQAARPIMAEPEAPEMGESEGAQVTPEFEAPRPASLEVSPLPALAASTEESLAPELHSRTDDPPILAAWPSISGRNNFSRPARADVFRAKSASSGRPLRRRFLPRD
jgi:type II secretory pathway predicted ATPase ExeA